LSSSLLSRMSSACTRNVLSSENGMVDLGKKKRRYAVGSDAHLYAFAKHLGYHYIEWTITPSGVASMLKGDGCLGHYRRILQAATSLEATKSPILTFHN
jgi:hypothetical protein